MQFRAILSISLAFAKSIPYTNLKYFVFIFRRTIIIWVIVIEYNFYAFKHLGIRRLKNQTNLINEDMSRVRLIFSSYAK